MKALVLHAVGDLRYEEVPMPRAGEGEAVVRVAACGICGSDLPRVYKKGTYHFPTIPGHEFAGTVAECNGDGFSVGDRVTVFPLLWCGRCAACEAGEYAQCSQYGYLGSRDDGGFAEYVVAPVRNLLRLPDTVDFDHGAMTEPTAVALHCLRRVGKPLVGATVAVYGAGPIGLIVAQWARAMGAARVAIFEISARKLEVARGLGFETVDSIDGGADVCVEAAGVPATLAAACRTVRRNGTVVLLGNPSQTATLPVEVISHVMRMEASLVGTWNSAYSCYRSDDDWRVVLSALAGGTIQLEPLISHRFALADGVEAFETMRDAGAECLKVMIRP